MINKSTGKSYYNSKNIIERKNQSIGFLLRLIIRGCLSKTYQVIYSDIYESGYFVVSTTYAPDVMGLIDYNGNEIFTSNAAKWFEPIPLTDKMIYQSKTDDKYGVMDFEGNILLEPTFDRLYVNRINEEDGQFKDVLIVGRNEEQSTTVVFNKDLGQELVGDYDYYEAVNMVVEKSNAKVYKK